MPDAGGTRDSEDHPLRVGHRSTGQMMAAEPWAEVYKAVRAHELMLNEASAAFERAVLTPLIALNGGAIVAFLTLLGALADKDARLTANIGWAIAAIGAWTAGLAAAGLAVRLATDSQTKISKAHRLMRERVEGVLLEPDLARIVALPPELTKELREQLDEEPDEDTARELLRERARTDAEGYAGQLRWAWRASAALFVVGGALAVCAITIDEDPPPPVRVPASLTLTAAAADRLGEVCGLDTGGRLVARARVEDLARRVMTVQLRAGKRDALMSLPTSGVVAVTRVPSVTPLTECR